VDIVLEGRVRDGGGICQSDTLAKVGLGDFNLLTGGPDGRGEITACRTSGEGRRWRFLRSVAEAVLQLLMETDVEGLIGAGRYERSGERATYQNGYRDRSLETRLGGAATAGAEAAAR
jgi:hypothetical protein